ncbi:MULTISPECIES: carbohydrate ABC transporter permease [unclassified Plantibacter]|jgi:ABC-type sugar transport system permease subunit|uniref:carbohydrate ABC transporter permease n=1 Tax=unclassified Plantibacter TaxID=2624265 RepID=UPI003D3478D4
MSTMIDHPGTGGADAAPPEGAGTPPAPRIRTKRHGRASSPLSAANRNDWKLGWLLVVPAIAGFLVFALYPTLRGIYLSFTNFRVLTPPTWIGLANYEKLLGDKVFWASLLTTLHFVVLAVVIGLGVSLATAVILHRVTKSTIMRGLIILPFLISSVVAGVVWSWMLDSQLGIVNLWLNGLTGETVKFLSDRAWVIPSLAVITVWKSMGYTTILIFAGLQTIPEHVYEAARMDGANELQMFRRITLPLLRPIMAMVTILTLISAFQVFDIVQVTTKGGPANASNVLQMYIYDKAFGQFDFGYAATMSLALFAMLMIISFTQMRLMRASQSDTN